MDIKS
jgi:hypothetical protein